MSFLANNSDSESEDNESFHSFNQTDSSFDNLSASFSGSDSDSAADFDSGSEHETSMENVEKTVEETQAAFSGVTLKPKSPESDIHSSDSSACDGVSTGKATQVMGRFKSPKKFTISPISEQKQDPVPCCPRDVPQLASNQMPSQELFNLDEPAPVLKEHLTTNRHTAAIQKYAFTEIWLGSQQHPSQPKSSRLRQFSVALEAYFDTESSKKEADDKWDADEESVKTNVAPSKDNKPVEEPVKQPVKEPVKEPMKEPVKEPAKEPVKEYVSPLPNLSGQPAPKVPPLLRGAKAPIIVPAGFDLTRLVELKNPNHWHRRPHMRTGDRIY